MEGVACQGVEEVMDDDSPPLDTEEDMRVALFYICGKRVWYQVTNISKPKAQVEYTGLKVNIQQFLNDWRHEPLAPETFRDKIMSYKEVNEHRQDRN